YVHVAVDDASRLSYTEVLPDERGSTVAAFLWRALAWYRRHGIRVQRVMTDNAFAYLGHAFQALCELRGIRHLRIRPYTPRTNGKAERFIQTCCANGPTGGPMDLRAPARPSCRDGCTT